MQLVGGGQVDKEVSPMTWRHLRCWFQSRPDVRLAWEEETEIVTTTLGPWASKSLSFDGKGLFSCYSPVIFLWRSALLLLLMGNVIYSRQAVRQYPGSCCIFISVFLFLVPENRNRKTGQEYDLARVEVRMCMTEWVAWNTEKLPASEGTACLIMCFATGASPKAAMKSAIKETLSTCFRKILEEAACLLIIYQRTHATWALAYLEGPRGICPRKANAYFYLWM